MSETNYETPHFMTEWHYKQMGKNSSAMRTDGKLPLDIEPAMKLVDPAGKGVWLVGFAIPWRSGKVFGVFDDGDGDVKMGIFDLNVLAKIVHPDGRKIEQDKSFKISGTLLEHAEALKAERIAA